jgi:Bacterial PH domain
VSDQIRLPIRYRPLGARMASGTAAVVLVILVAFLWLSLPDEVQHDFTLTERITLIVFFVAVLAVLNGVFRTNALAEETGLTIVNGYHAHRFTWPELVRISLTRNRPWALIDLADGETVAVMAIASSDGDRAKAAARQLAQVMAQQSQTDRND